MSTSGDWWVWPLGLAVLALFALFFWHVAARLFETLRHVIGLIDRWPEIRRQMVEAEARAPGGRYPLWFRAVRVALVLVMIVGSIWLIAHKILGVV